MPLRRHGTFLFAVLLATPLSVCRLHAQTLADYAIVDRIEDDWVNRNPVPVRPMAIHSDGSVWAVNPYLGTLCKIVGTTVTTFRTLPGPVSVALHPEVSKAYVACQHANAVAVHSLTTGDILDVVFVRAQPQDVLLTAGAPRRLWVSCAAADVVVSIDTANLNGAQVTYAVPAKSPTFLTLGPGDQVLVAARLSGNGSVVERQPNIGTVPNSMAGPRGIIDTLDSTQAEVALPDRDLFWLDPATATAKPVAANVGTLLFAGGMRPTTAAEYWQLNTDAKNKDPNRQSEPAIRGDFVANRLTIVTLPALVGTPAVKTAANHTVKVLDLSGSPTIPDGQIGIPYSVAFRADGARCWIAGLLTDNIAEFNAAGARTGRVVKFVAGSMPRQVMYGANASTLHVWCGDNKVRTHVLTTATTTAVSLGFDPTPANIREGRRLFFDASHSALGNASCASCHDEGKTDMLAWNLSKVDVSLNPDDGLDNKGPMVTQTLVGIDRAMPFHWRGEQQRGMLDFNDAFVGLLGGTKINEANGDFANFESYILSLTEDANQFQHPLRKVDGARLPPAGSGITPGDAVAGQNTFRLANQCIQCHRMPSGTNNEVVSNVFVQEGRPKRLWLKVAPFQGLQFKAGQPQVNIDFLMNGLSDLLPYPISGTGLSHAGVVNNIETFTRQMIPGGDVNVANFMLQFDSGMAPATHAVVFLRPGRTSAGAFTLNDLLATTPVAGQATTAVRNCDVAVIGRVTIAGTSRVAGWVYQRVDGLFQRDDGVLQSRAALEFLAAQNGNWMAFLGMPVGTARGFAVDSDRDQLLNAQEPAIANSQFNVDSDGDSFWDGHEAANPEGDPANPAAVPNDRMAATVDFLPAGLVPATDGGPYPFQWRTERVARLTFETNELTRATLTFMSTTAGDPVVVATQTAPKLQHDFVVATLLPGRTYNVTLSVTDLANNVTSPVMPAVAMLAPPTTVAQRTPALVSSLVWNTPAVAGGSIRLQPSGSVITRNDGLPLGNARVIARVLINGRPATAAELSGPSEQANFRVNGFIYPASLIPGPFVIAPATTAGGAFAMDFTLTGVASGSTIELSVEVIGVQITATPVNIGSTLPPLEPLSGVARFIPQLFGFPDTPAAFRSIKMTMP